MKKEFYIIIFLVFLLSFTKALPNFNFVISLNEDAPIVSRFKTITFYITNSDKIIFDSIKLYCNNTQINSFIKQNSVKNNILLISFKPFIPLKYGFNKITILFADKSGNLVTKSLTFLVDPAAKPYLAPYIIKVRQYPDDPQAHYFLAQAYEKLHLLEDAQSEYLTAYKLAPNFIAAKLAYERIFALWGSKQIKKKNIIVNTSIDSSIKDMARILIFTITIYNNSNNDISINTEKITLKDDLNNVFYPLYNYEDKLKSDLDNNQISYDNYIKSTYFLEKFNIKLQKQIKIVANTYKTFYLLYKIANKSSKNFNILIKINNEKFSFPFIIN